MIFRENYFIFISICWILLLSVNFIGIPVHAEVTVMLSGSVPLAACNISANGIGSDNATITWKTNGNANSSVEYGNTTAYGSTSSDDVMEASHTIRLYNLSSCTVYHYRVTSTMLDETSYNSADATFETLCPNGAIVVTTNLSTLFQGVTIMTGAGVQQVSLNLSSISGIPTISGNSVTVSNPGNGWSKVQYVASSVTSQNGNVSTGPIQSVSMATNPVAAFLGGTIGTVSTQINIGLTQIVSDLTIQQSIIYGASPTVSDAFQIAATNNNLNVQAIAYTVEFQNTAQVDANLDSAGVEMDLSVDHAWVAANAQDGSVNNVKIFRLGDDGTKEVLGTTYLGSQGTTDYFQALSPHGLSTFGIVAVASSSTTGGGSSSRGETRGESNGGGGGSKTGNAQNVGPQGQQLLAPLQNAFTTTQSLAVAGLRVTTGSSEIQTFTLDTALAAQSGVSVTVGNNEITLTQPGLIQTIVTRGSPSEENGIISGTVQSDNIVTTPSAVNMSFGTVSVSIDATLATIPENGVITTTLSEEVRSDVRSAFQLAANDNNQQVEAIAYVMTVETTNFVATGPATVTMTISPEWVASHGGTGAVSIIRMSDAGTGEMLDTSYKGIDPQGTMVFEGNSPHGLYVFGIVQATPLKPAQQKQSGANSGGLLLQTAFGKASAIIGVIVGVIKSNYVLLIVFAGLIGIILAYANWHNRRRAQKKRK